MLLELFRLPLFLPSLALVFFRIGAMLFAAPLFSSVIIPVRLRIGLAFVLALLAFPIVGPTIPSTLSAADAVGAVAGELLIGIVLGLGVSIVFFGVQFAGGIIEREAGMALGAVFNPLMQGQTSVLGQLYFFIATMIFLSIRGHHALILAVLDSFESVRPMTFTFNASLPGVLIDLLGTAMVLGLRIAAPALVALFLTSFALGFIGRTVPQINILTIGFSIRVAIAIFITAVALHGLFDLFRASIIDTFDALRDAVAATGA